MIGLSSKLERPSVDEGVSSAAKAGTQVEQTDGWSHGLGDNRGNAGGLRVFFFFFAVGVVSVLFTSVIQLEFKWYQWRKEMVSSEDIVQVTCFYFSPPPLT